MIPDFLRQNVLFDITEDYLRSQLAMLPTGSFAFCWIRDVPAMQTYSLPMTIEYAREHTLNEEQAQSMMYDKNPDEIRILYTTNGGIVKDGKIKMIVLLNYGIDDLKAFYSFLTVRLCYPIDKKNYYDQASNFRRPGRQPFINY